MAAVDDTGGEDLDAKAERILRQNDLGGFTIPRHGLYPYQWNWDSGFVALGFATFDTDRAWQELETLLDAQWSNGMVPHIVFRANDPDYFPGPDVWDTPVTPPTSGYSQPPIATSAARRLAEQDQSPTCRDRARTLFPRLLRWHRWFHEARDPDGLGIIAMAHPWEAGRDNSPDWDEPMAMIDTSGVGQYQRRDTEHVNADMRPRKADYDRYLTLIKFGRETKWDPSLAAQTSPFWVADPGTTMILLRADRDLRWLADLLGESDAAREIDGWIGRAEEGVERLWNADIGAYCALDLRSGRLADGLTSASFLAFYAGLGQSAASDALIANLRRVLGEVRFGVPSFDPAHSKFDALRYWRGPSWAVMNFLLAQGLREQGYDDLATRLRNDTRELVRISGFNEYYCPLTGRGCGGADFSWTAAIWLSWVSPSQTSLAA